MVQIQAEVYKVTQTADSYVLVVNAATDDETGESDTAAHTSTEQPAQPTKVEGVLDTHMNVVPFFAGGMLVLLVAALIMRPGSSKRKAVGNETVGSAKLLIENDEHEAAIEMLKEHLELNPGDDRAKALLKRATAED